MDYRKVVEELISYLNNIKRSILYLSRDSAIGYFKGEHYTYENSEERDKYIEFQLHYYPDSYTFKRYVIYKSSYKLPDNWVFDDNHWGESFELDTKDLKNQFYQRVWFELTRYFILANSLPSLEGLDGAPSPVFEVKDLLYHRPDQDLITVIREKQLQS